MPRRSTYHGVACRSPQVLSLVNQEAVADQRCQSTATKLAIPTQGRRIAMGSSPAVATSRVPPSPPAEKATASQGDPAAAAHSMRASAQVTAPGAATNMIVAVSTRPNRQNRSTCSRMSLSTKAKVEGGKSVTRPAEPKPTSWPLRWSTPSRRQIRTQLVLVSVPCSPPGYPVGNPS
jgi:hypothetical protein